MALAAAIVLGLCTAGMTWGASSVSAGPLTKDTAGSRSSADDNDDDDDAEKSTTTTKPAVATTKPATTPPPAPTTQPPVVTDPPAPSAPAAPQTTATHAPEPLVPVVGQEIAKTTESLVVSPKVTPGDTSKVGGSSSAGWQVACPTSHSSNDDPIVFFGRAGASHQHSFMGSKTTNASSTTAKLLAGDTTCTNKDDKSPYWVPTLFNNGTAVHPTHGEKGPTGVSSRQTMYYRNPTGKKLHAFPAGLRMISGNPAAKSLKENPQVGRNIWWGCSDNSISQKLTAPPAKCPRGMITVHIHFPNCWDGVNLDSANHQSHVAFSSGGNCPASHPVIIPRLTIRNEYIVGTTTGKITLSSGDVNTIHADFWNAWNQPALEKLVANCFNAGKNCGKL